MTEDAMRIMREYQAQEYKAFDTAFNNAVYSKEFQVVSECMVCGRPSNECRGHENVVRTFETGATRDTSSGKFQYAGYLSPYFINAFGRYMNKHQLQANGVRRESDNWQKGMPLPVYVDSAFRHFVDFWAIARGIDVYDEKGQLVDMSEAIMGLFFNIQGYWHELMKSDNEIQRGA